MQNAGEGPIIRVTTPPKNHLIIVSSLVFAGVKLRYV